MKCSILLAFVLSACTLAHASDKGVTPTEIKLGASAVLSGPLGAQTSEYGVGSRLYFDAVNAAGGVHGRKISYVTLDDGFDVKRAAENTRKLIDEHGVFMIYNNTGTAQTAAILPLLEQSKTLVFGPRPARPPSATSTTPTCSTCAPAMRPRPGASSPS
jgi:ABC-type branched-subunit amino acid transport system substrate-binding protein